MTVSVLNFLQLSVQFTANGGTAKRNGFYFPILVLSLNLVL